MSPTDVMVYEATLTEQLQSFMQGDATTADALVRRVLPKLREIALREIRRERYVAPLTATELISELWVNSLAKGGWQILDRGHFFALASLAMRRILVGYARKRLAECRGGGMAVLSLDERCSRLAPSVEDAAQIVEIDIELNKLATKDSYAARMVDMHYFGGFTLDEIAHATGCSRKKVRLGWERGRDWLKLAQRSKTSSKAGPAWNHLNINS